MIIKELTLTDWRNYHQAALSPHPELNIFLGANGQGKTNLLESIYYLCYGKNFRANKERELVRWNCEYFRLQALFQADESARSQHLEMYYDAVRHKKIKLNGVRYSRMNKLPDRLSAVLFTPDDLAIIKGGPGERRRFLDRELEALFVDYEDVRHAYERVLAQRAELLREIRAGRSDKNLLAPWNLQLVTFGVRMTRSRLEILRVLVPQARRVHAFLTGEKGHFDVTYQSSLGNILDSAEEVMQAQFLSLLEQIEGEEIRRAQNLAGPHRDDLVFYENGIDLRTYGSQGQQRTAILSMKMAAIDTYEKRLGQKPLLLLDDVMSELDLSRQRAVMEIVTKKHIQTFITAAQLDFHFQGFGYDPVFVIEEGNVRGRREDVEE